MKDIRVVIGANFGDEGKGLITDYFSSMTSNGVIVRFNGGAQAGHTVTTPEGKRHVFGHFGSGSFLGLPTFLSSFFVVNPMVFAKEFHVLHQQGINPKVYMDKDCLVTTPYDMMINQIVEILRGDVKHGSCGLGFNETIERSLLDKDVKITVSDLSNEKDLREKLEYIQTQYIQYRLDKLQIKKEAIPVDYQGLLNNPFVIDHFIEDVRIMLDQVEISNIKVLKSFQCIIFEGAQGLLLDQNHENFPHVTRSHTGMSNVVALLNQLDYFNNPIEIVYVTRAYMTRHGNGPFQTELNKKPYEKIIDLTNVPNPYQGVLRFGLLDVDLLSKTIQNDLEKAKALRYKYKLAITCLDQISDTIDYYVKSKKVASNIDDFITQVMDSVGVHKAYLSYGATRNTIKQLKQ